MLVEVTLGSVDYLQRGEKESKVKNGMSSLSKKNVVIRDENILDSDTSDVCGPMKTKEHLGLYSYFVTFIDDAFKEGFKGRQGLEQQRFIIDHQFYESLEDRGFLQQFDSQFEMIFRRILKYGIIRVVLVRALSTILRWSKSLSTRNAFLSWFRHGVKLKWLEFPRNSQLDKLTEIRIVLLLSKRILKDWIEFHMPQRFMKLNCIYGVYKAGFSESSLRCGFSTFLSKSSSGIGISIDIYIASANNWTNRLTRYNVLLYKLANVLYKSSLQMHDEFGFSGLHSALTDCTDVFGSGLQQRFALQIASVFGSGYMSASTD
ncbi:hypothetical protein Tco_0647677 [Tanacetum coccineum]